MRLEPVIDVAHRSAALAGNTDLPTAPGWPHDGSLPGMSFLDNGGLVFLVIDDEGRIAGDCGTKSPPDDDGVVEIGYGLAAPSRGQGLGSRAVSALLDELASHPDVTRVDAEVHESNDPSWRILRTLGFTAIGEPDGHGFRRYRKVLSPR